MLQSMAEEVILDTSFSVDLVDKEMSDNRPTCIFCVIRIQSNQSDKILSEFENPETGCGGLVVVVYGLKQISLLDDFLSATFEMRAVLPMKRNW